MAKFAARRPMTSRGPGEPERKPNEARIGAVSCNAYHGAEIALSASATLEIGKKSHFATTVSLETSGRSGDGCRRNKSMNYVDRHLETYNRPQVVENYAKDSGLQACEDYLFDKYVESGDAILDIGVGGGRTTPHLSGRAAKYIGVDYSQSMVAVCQRKFPTLEFYCENACDLRRFEDARFDVVVFSYNGMDCIGSVEARMDCLREVFRVLKSGGRFIFSSHNAKQLGWWPRLYDGSLLRKVLRIGKALCKSPQQVAYPVVPGSSKYGMAT
jgi:ubiquinone/menaquinone biosynthesis C-methylase UbiE